MRHWRGALWSMGSRCRCCDSAVERAGAACDANAGDVAVGRARRWMRGAGSLDAGREPVLEVEDATSVDVSSLGTLGC